MTSIAAYKFIGRKDKNSIDSAAVEAINSMLSNVPIKCRIVCFIGEGEVLKLLQDAYLAAANPNAILKLSEMYMEKLFVRPALANTININEDFITNIKNAT